MIANKHLLYVDITTKCGLGCNFCMYNSFSNNGADLCLSDLGYSQLEKLINHPDVQHIIISGEGEPFKALKVMLNILKLSRGGNYFQIITNGYWIDDNEMIEKFIKEISLTKDKISIRFSLDSFHQDILGNELYKKIVNMAIIYSSKNISFAFRSLLEEQDDIRKLITEIIGIVPEPTSALDDNICINGTEINITYKNIVFPKESPSKISMYKYIDLLSIKYMKSFTFGNLATDDIRPGLDITVKPSGDVYFYGADDITYCNLNNETVDIESLILILKNTPLLNVLYSIPFREVLQKISCQEINNMIEIVNNPYWLIKSLPKKYIRKIKELNETN
jgi:organic radical activating enzyme